VHTAPLLHAPAKKNDEND